MSAPLHVHVPPELRFFLPARRRAEEAVCPYDGTSSLGHVVAALGIPPTEVGRLRVEGRSVPGAYRPPGGARVEVEAVARPQPLPPSAPAPPRFVLDVHLGALARRMRLVGVDTAYRNDAADPELVTEANAELRILLTQDRGLLRRRALWLGAYVRGSAPDDQLTDVLTRFDVPLDPWTRCPVCNGTLEPVAKAEVQGRIPPGTRRTYDTFTRCTACARVYWPGAHHARLASRVRAARAAAGRERTPHDPPESVAGRGGAGAGDVLDAAYGDAAG
ncbi:Mut7-C RNAse domain-containing protein [Streptomyces sp. HNM0574]|uniref:Mut7-C RNAse domain-containing protein n=1 Tax=Streptomyces sp. HNM0574 TaxID=2714954 RepID=UPI003217E088